MRYLPYCAVIALTSLSSGIAAAEDTLKGTYSFVGTQVCLSSPAGFKRDINGNFTIPVGETNVSQTTTEGEIVYNGDGTGKATQTFVTTVPPPNPYGAAISAGTISYSFTYAPESDRSYRMMLKPDSFQGRLDAGPNAGQQFSIDVGSRVLRVSDDRRHITFGIAKPYVEKITFSGSPEFPVPRICTAIGTQALADKSIATIGQSK
ncbi:MULTISPECIES: hypothetical protein [unclassified Bradyrhizobium]|uniref:hypothetical protein n=1 Tax=unclassified Bradyrhizobium TaxID=2631580 RepID=UPI0028E9BA29|nr:MULTISPECIES: hypothetical protein [unclassified Bradyrhizobium]